MTDFGTTPVSDTTIAPNTFPVSAVYVPNTAGSNLTAVEGGPVSTDASGKKSAPMAVAGSFAEMSLGPVSGQNTYLLPITDVSRYRYFNFQFPPQSINLTATFQQSNDGVNFAPLTVTRADGVRTQNVSQNNGGNGGQFSSPIWFRYLAVQITQYNSGSVSGLVELYTLPISPSQVGASITDTDGNPLRGNQSTVNYINANGVTGTQTGIDQVNNSAKGVLAYLNVQTIGTGSLVLHIQGKDVVSGNYGDLLVASTAITANGTYVYELYPGVSGGAVAQAVSGILPKDWRIQVVGANGSTFFVNYALEM